MAEPLYRIRWRSLSSEEAGAGALDYPRETAEMIVDAMNRAIPRLLYWIEPVKETKEEEPK